MRLDLNNTLEPLRVRLADSGEDVRGLESRMVALEEQLIVMNERLAAIADSGAGTNVSGRRGAAGSPMPPPQRPAGVPGPSVAQPAAMANTPVPVPTSRILRGFQYRASRSMASRHPVVVS